MNKIQPTTCSTLVYHQWYAYNLQYPSVTPAVRVPQVKNTLSIVLRWMILTKPSYNTVGASFDMIGSRRQTPNPGIVNTMLYQLSYKDHQHLTIDQRCFTNSGTGTPIPPFHDHVMMDWVPTSVHSDLT